MMFKIRFYNGSGEVTFGGGKSESGWRITECDGLAVTGKSFTVCKYACEDGQQTVSARKNARTITLSGDFFSENNALEYRNAMRVFSEKGVLEVYTDGETRRTTAYCSVFSERGREGKYRLFTIQFICDSPYFETDEAYEVPIYKTIPLLDNDFEFPGKFSERISRSTVMNAGDVTAEPILYITAGHNPTGIVTVKNHTTEQKLSVNYEPLADETVIIDASERRIYNSAGENLLGYLSDDSFFDGFYLAPGENDIEVLSGGANLELEVSCRFRPRYSEAVYIC